MHDGSLASLDEVVRHYDRGGTSVPGQDPGSGRSTCLEEKSATL
jgi:hypothetical protein